MMLLLLRSSCNYIAQVEMQMYGLSLGFVYNIRQFTLYVQRNAEFLLTFTNDTLLTGFTHFNLATGELP